MYKTTHEQQNEFDQLEETMRRHLGLAPLPFEEGSPSASNLTKLEGRVRIRVEVAITCDTHDGRRITFHHNASTIGQAGAVAEARNKAESFGLQLVAVASFDIKEYPYELSRPSRSAR